MSQNFKQAAADSSTSPEPPPKKQRLVADNRISDVLVPVNPITALRNLIELPKLNFESQDEPTKLFIVSTTFSGHLYKASDPSNFDGAKIKLASQILHFYILNHAFWNGNVSHHARIIEGKNNGSMYIVGQEKTGIKSADEMHYTLYELKPNTRIWIELKPSELNSFKDRTEIPNYLATVVINDRFFSAYGNQENVAIKEAIRSALASFTPEDMGFIPVCRRPIQSVVEENTFINFPAEIDQPSPPQTQSAMRDKLEFLIKNGPSTLALLKPQVDCGIVKRDYEYSTGFMYTARVNICGVNYDCTERTKKLAKKKATSLALRSLSDEEVLKLSMLVRENEAKESARLLLWRAEMDQIAVRDSNDETDRRGASANTTENLEMKMKTKLRFSKSKVLTALNRLKPKTKSVVIRQDVLTTGKTVYTARVTHGGVHYQSTESNRKTARREAAFKALSDLDADEADRLARLLPPGSVMPENSANNYFHGEEVKRDSSIPTRKTSNANMRVKTIDDHAERAIRRAEKAARNREKLKQRLDDDIDQIINLVMGRPCAERSNAEPAFDVLNADQISAGAVDYTAEDVESVPQRVINIDDEHNQPVPVVDNIIKMKTRLRFVKKRAIPALALLQPSPYIAVVETGVTSFGGREYTATVTINGVTYEGRGTRKSARKKAAFKALSDLDADEADKLAKILPPDFLMGEKAANIHQDLVTANGNKNTLMTNMVRRYTDQSENSPEREANDPEISSQPGSSSNTENGEDHSFGDYISKLVEDAFQQSIKNDPSKSTYKVLAGIVMSNGIAINGSAG